ncbi:hypothetical protein KSF_008580 [Reticulibacter mediterranei]|uniref:Zinc ribbon domain-containing protein n=1 Tax=Reticulibacter mediterranei TaxID=2778369 RepID=A0A8J3IHG0_9CHLR|nr:zinc ribbon domain-containing protein [Reticulibacter mediterranei]GHO90810.1 hypothetical protein KSF_008580 [Reticulibacter mediterranei]
MTKPITGQYECQHSSGIGLDYFTSRIDRLILQPDGHFTLTIQERSRLSNAAQSLVSGQQITNAAPEKKREGTYTVQGNTIVLHFQDGAQEQGQVSWNGEGLQLGKDFFNKVSDSTLLPPTHRLQKDMDDIAKGIKIATTVGGIALKAAKTIHNTLQSTQSTDAATPPDAGPAQHPVPQPAQQPPQPAAQPARPEPPPPPQPVQSQMEAIFCDQCGARSRPGKKFCGNCGARLV